MNWSSERWPVRSLECPPTSPLELSTSVHSNRAEPWNLGKDESNLDARGNRSPSSPRLSFMATWMKAAVHVTLAALLVSCISGVPAEKVFRVTGSAHAGPVCPVQQDPPDPACADKPVAGAALVIVDVEGREVAAISTDADGRFETMLPAGDYTIVPQPVEGLLGTAQPQAFTTGPGLAPVLDVGYDTGIR